MENSFTKVLDEKDEDGIGEDVWVCDDCGAHGPVAEEIQHHRTCEPGKWIQYYADCSN